MRKPSTRVMEIFSEAATTDADQRRGYLDRACEGDDELRSEVESLLNTQERIDGFLGSPTVEGEQLARPEVSGLQSSLSIARDQALIGPYTLIERIGEGGFGVVYCARQNHPIRREVALKIVKLGMDTRQVIARFESERQALALMDHPNIARIFDTGATPDGRPYFVMELARGSPITQYCDDQRLTIPQRMDLFIAVCHAIQHAHQKGIIHRDLKPSNILVVQVDGLPVPKVIDFGIAKAMAPTLGEQTARTELRHVLGTPEYMSPEQAGAGNGDIDTRSDIYSLGVLLYELLTGATPFDPQALRQASLEQVHRIIREDDPPRPSARLSAMGPLLAEVAERRGLDGQKLRRTVARELDWIVIKALEKDRRQRYETVGALAEDVRRYLVHEPLLAGPPDTLYRVRKFTRRHRKPLLAAGAVMLALLLGLAGTTFGLVRAKRDRDRAEAALAQAEQISAFLTDMLRSANPDRAKGSQVLVREVIDRTSRSIEQGALKEQPLVEAGIRMALGGAYDSLGLYPDSESHFRKALEIRRRLLGTQNRQTAGSMASLAWEVCNRADFEEAESLIRQALAIQQKILGDKHLESIGSLNRLGSILRAKGDTAAAGGVLRQVVELTRSVAPHGDSLASSLTSLGVLLMDKKDWDGAEPLLNEALALDRKLHGELYRNVARNLSNLAVIHKGRGDLKGAEEYWFQSLRIQRQILPADHPDTGWTLRLLGQVKYAQDELPAAEKYFRESLDTERKVFGAQHPIVASILEELSNVLQDAGQPGEAISLRKQVMQIRLAREAAALAAHPNDAAHLAALATLHLRSGDFRQASDELNRATTLNPSDHWYWYMAACLRCYLGDSAGYREACHGMLDRFSASDRPEIADRTAKACLLWSTPATDLDRLNRLADRALAGPSAYAAWFQMTRGLAEYRAGRYRAAREWFTKASALDSQWGTPTVKLLLAMTDFHLGNTTAAHAGYRTVLDQVNRGFPKPGDDDLGVSPENFLVYQVLAREAATMFRDGAPTSGPSQTQPTASVGPMVSLNPGT